MSLDYDGYVAYARDTYRLYESMGTDTLLQLQSAFNLDLAAATMPETIAFAGGRLALIRDVLGKRGIRPDHATIASITCPVCQRVSYNANDIAEKYCGFCHRFHEDLPRGTSQTSGKSQTS